MVDIISISQIHEAIAAIRNLRNGFVTNFYLDEEKHCAWICTGKFRMQQMEKSIFFLLDHEDGRDIEDYFTNLFYVSTSYEQVSADIQSLSEVYSYDQYVIDVVGRDSQCQTAVDALFRVGAKQAASLVRMTRINVSMEYESDKNVEFASIEDLPWLNNTLHRYFNAKLEQLPLMEELERYVNRHWILKCVENGQIIGFIILEKNASTLYLRYWFTLPEYREKRVGSRLLRRFFEEGKDTRRQILWVMQDNENAIKRYEHYGFKNENMYDYIMIK